MLDVRLGMLKKPKNNNKVSQFDETTLKNLLFIFKIKPDFVSRNQKLKMSHSFKEIRMPEYIWNISASVCRKT